MLLRSSKTKLKFFCDSFVAMTAIDRYDKLKIANALKDICRLLSDKEQTLFLSALRLKRFKKNETIYREGDRPDDLLCLLSGKVKIYRDGIGGRGLINRVLRPVQYFGYRASMADEPYVTAAAAFEESVVAFVPMQVVYQLMKSNSALSMFFIGELAKDLGLSDKRIVSITQKHVRGRLAEALLYLLEIYGCESDGVTLDALVSREDLANLSNMTTSNAIRTLSNFVAEEIVEVHGRRIKYLDLEALCHISANG